MRSIFFLHIPKTAGTTFFSILDNIFPSANRAHIFYPWVATKDHHPDKSALKNVFNTDGEMITDSALTEYKKNSIIYGHAMFGYQARFPFPVQIFTILRDPLQRIISEYNHTLQTNHVLNRYIVEREIDFFNYATSDYSLSSDNLQVRLLSGEHLDLPHGKCGERQLEKAKANLSQMQCFGLTEKFDESLLLFAYKFQWPVSELGYKRRRVGQKKINKSMISQSEYDIIMEKNKYDLELYDYAKLKFEQFVQELKKSDSYDNQMSNLHKNCQLIEKKERFLRKFWK